MARGQHRGGRTQALQRETGEGIKQHGQAGGYHQASHDLQRKAPERESAEQRGRHMPLAEPPGYVYGDHTRSQDQKDEGTDDGKSARHGEWRTDQVFSSIAEVG